MACRKAVFLALTLATASGIKVGDMVPDVSLDKGFPPNKVSLREATKGKKVVLVGLPGAFTPTWSTRQIPGYLEKQDQLKAAGVDKVIVFAVNDGAVMNAWEEDQKTAGTLVDLMGDTRMELTKALDLVLNHPGPMGVLGNNRCKRFSALLVNGVIKTLNVAAAEDDPAGDDRPEISMVDKMLEDLKANRDEL